MPQLDFAHYPFLSQFFWLFISFIALYISSAKVILPRISKTMEMRDNTVKNALQEAESLKKESDSFLTEFQESITDAQTEANRIIQTAQSKVKAKTDAAITKAEKEISNKIAQGQKNIEAFANDNDTTITKLSDDIYDNLIKKYTNV